MSCAHTYASIKSAAEQEGVVLQDEHLPIVQHAVNNHGLSLGGILTAIQKWGPVAVEIIQTVLKNLPAS